MLKFQNITNIKMNSWTKNQRFFASGKWGDKRPGSGQGLYRPLGCKKGLIVDTSSGHNGIRVRNDISGVQRWAKLIKKVMAMKR